VLQQANSIISKITANLNLHEQGLPPLPNDHAMNSGNSFGIASYGDQQMRFDAAGGCGPRTISKLITMTCRIIGASCTHLMLNPTIVEANSKIDNHADMCCLGANFIPLYFMGKICDISPFLESMPLANNIEICSSAMAYDDPNSTTVILVVNEALWMGNHMQHSLLNPCQICAVGISLCNDPMDPNQYFGIKVESTQVALKMQGTTCTF